MKQKAKTKCCGLEIKNIHNDRDLNLSTYQCVKCEKTFDREFRTKDKLFWCNHD